MLYIFISNVLLAKTNVTRGLNDLQFIEDGRVKGSGIIFCLDLGRCENCRRSCSNIPMLCSYGVGCPAVPTGISNAAQENFRTHSLPPVFLPSDLLGYWMLRRPFTSSAPFIPFVDHVHTKMWMSFCPTTRILIMIGDNQE